MDAETGMEAMATKLHGWERLGWGCVEGGLIATFDYRIGLSARKARFCSIVTWHRLGVWILGRCMGWCWLVG